MTTIQIAARFAGPPSMVHGGYVAGLLAERMSEFAAPGASQITLRRPTPFDSDLALEREGERLRLTASGEVLVEAEPAQLELELPAPPTLEAARAAEAGSPSLYQERGVHPICFGCGVRREAGDALRIFAGPCEVEGRALVAATWLPGAEFAGPDGHVATRYVLAALDCPGAFAFIVAAERAGLLGRIVFEQRAPVPADAECIVAGWQIGRDGRKLFAGTALYDASGRLYAAARATWFGFAGRR